MSNFFQYDSIINAYLLCPEKFFKEHPLPSNLSPESTLILSLKKEFSVYEKQMALINIHKLDPLNIDFLFLLEGNINYLSSRFPKQVYTKKTNPKKEEFVANCNKALAIYPYAFFAAGALAWLYEIHDKPKEAYELLTRIWQHGFQTNRIADGLVFLSAINKDWENGKIYSTFPQSLIFRLLLQFFLLIRRYHIFIFLYIILITLTMIIKPWLLLLSGICVLNFLLVLISIWLKSKVISTMGVLGVEMVIFIGFMKVLPINQIGDFLFRIF